MDPFPDFDYNKICNIVNSNFLCRFVLENFFFVGNKFNLFDCNTINESDESTPKKDTCDEFCLFSPEHIWNCETFRDFIASLGFRDNVVEDSSSEVRTIEEADKLLRFTVLARMKLPLQSEGDFYVGRIYSTPLYRLTKLLCLDDDNVSDTCQVRFESCSGNCANGYPAGCPNNTFHHDGATVAKGKLPASFFLGTGEVYCVLQLQVESVVREAGILLKVCKMFFFDDEKIRPSPINIPRN